MEKEEQLKEWEPNIVAVFKRIMGWDVTPRIYYTSSSDFRQKRKEIVEKIDCRDTDCDDTESDICAMEFIRGEKEDAILVKTDSPACENEKIFSRCIWHELGHFVILAEEDPEFRHYMEEDLPWDEYTMLGHWFWGEFAAEAIAFYVADENRKASGNFGPEKGDWPPQLKKSTFNTLSIVANDALQHMNFSLFIHALSSYYARLLKDCIYISYRKAEPGKEATAISTVPKDYQELMYGLLEILEGRMKYEDFWNGDLDLFQKIGYVISELRLIQSLEALCG